MAFQNNIKHWSKKNITKIHVHDFFFRLIYANPDHAKDLLHLAFRPRELSLFNLKTLKSEKDTYLAGVEEGILEERRSDLVFSVRLKGGKQKAHIFLLFEHKSYQDSSVFLQLLRYQTSIYGQDPYAVVFPIIIYHGKKPKWKGPMNFQESLKGLTPTVRESFSKDILNFNCRLVNIAALNLDKETKGLTTRSVLLSLQNAWHLNDAVIKKFLYFSKTESKNIFLNTCEYIKRCNPRYNNSKLQKIALKIFKKEDYMKAVYQEFIEVGLEEGLEKGLEKGRQEEKKQVAVNLLKEGTDVEFVKKITGLSKREIESLKSFKN